MTPAQLEAFQRTHRNHLGRKLLVDGIQGPETEWALDFETIALPRRAIVAVGQTYLGLEELPLGSNGEPTGTIQGWLERCGARPGDPWCAAFASHCLGVRRIAGAQRLGRSFPATTEPWPGDVMWYPTTGEQGHCGIVIGVGAVEVMTLEGNLRHGVRCVRRPRAGLRFARTVIDTEGTCPGVVPSVTLVLGAGAQGTR